MDNSKYRANLVKVWMKALLGSDKSVPMCMPLIHSKILYIPVPKAANTSIKHALSKTLHIDISDTSNIHQDNRIPKEKLSNISHLIDDEWFVFTVVRNPLSRSISAYKDKVLKDGAKIAGVRELGIDKDDTHLRLLKNINRWPKKLLNNHFIPQSLLLQNALTIPNLKIFRFEELDAAWSEISKEVEKRTGEKLEPLRALNSTGRAIQTEIGQEERSLIRKIYKKDFELLNY